MKIRTRISFDIDIQLPLDFDRNRVTPDKVVLEGNSRYAEKKWRELIADKEPAKIDSYFVPDWE